MVNDTDNVIELNDFRQPVEEQERTSSVKSMQFLLNNKVVMEVRSDGVLVPGPGLSEDEATKRIIDCIASIWSVYMGGQEPSA